MTTFDLTKKNNKRRPIKPIPIFVSPSAFQANYIGMQEMVDPGLTARPQYIEYVRDITQKFFLKNID